MSSLLVRASSAAIVLCMMSQAPALAQVQSAASEHVVLDEDIIVTATRRAESLQKVPIAITAFSNEAVQNNRIINFQDVSSVVPGTTFVSTKGSSTATIQIRGQYFTNDSPSFGQPIAIFVDDVYYGSQAAFDADFFDVEQIAILRGPQGTTFGRNVVGGALQVTSKRAVLGEQSGQLNLTLNSRPGVEANGFFNVPMGEKVAARLAFSVHNTDGYLDNQVTGTKLNDRRSWALRGNLRFQPTDDLDVQLLAQYNRQDQHGAGHRLIGEGAQAAAQASSSFWDVFDDDDGVTKRRIFAGQFRVDYEQDFGTITSLTSYRSLDSIYREDGDGGPLSQSHDNYNNQDEWQFSQEVRLTSASGGSFEYVAGAYYSKEKLYKLITLRLDGTVDGNAYFLGNQTGNSTASQDASQDARIETFAPFVEGTIHLTDSLALRLGGRYTWERKHGYTRHVGTSPFYGAAYDVDFRKSWKAFTPRAILEYQANSETLLYASISRGFKGGGWSIASSTATAAAIPLNPEHSTSYELGLKSRFLDGAGMLNIAAYYAKTTDLQVRTLLGGALTDANAGYLDARGVEVEASIRPVAGALFGVNYAYNGAKYGSFKGCTATGVDCTGNRPPYTPRHDATIHGSYAFSTGDGALVTLRGDTKFASSYEITALNNQNFTRPYTDVKGLTNVSLTYEPSHGNWRLQGWARNVLNTKSVGAAPNYFFYHLLKTEYTAGMREVARVTPLPSRVFGLTFTANLWGD